jgi:hypothetical protein
MSLVEACKFNHVGYDKRWYVSATKVDSGDYRIVVRDTIAKRDVEELLVSATQRDKQFELACQRWSLK